MDYHLKRWAKFNSDNHVRGTPHLGIKLTANSILSLTLPYEIQIEIYRSSVGAQRSCIVKWSPRTDGFANQNFILVRQNNGLEVVDLITPPNTVEERGVWVHTSNESIWELQPGKSVMIKFLLPALYQRRLNQGEHYYLYWAGGEIIIWEWGTIEEFSNQELHARPSNESNRPRILLPCGPHIGFAVKHETSPWPDRTVVEAIDGYELANIKEENWRVQNSLLPSPKFSIATAEAIRDPDAPILNMRLEGAPTVTLSGLLEVTAIVTYEGVSDSKKQPRPITFHLPELDDYCSGFDLSRKHLTWWENSEHGNSGFQIWDDPDVTLTVGGNKDFVTLYPGETWTTTHQVYYKGIEYFVIDTQVGDTFGFTYKGCTLDWWDWGTGDDHKDTQVRVPCVVYWRINSPTDNGGRPPLVVPPSNAFEFTIIPDPAPDTDDELRLQDENVSDKNHSPALDEFSSLFD